MDCPLPEHREATCVSLAPCQCGHGMGPGGVCEACGGTFRPPLPLLSAPSDEQGQLDERPRGDVAGLFITALVIVVFVVGLIDSVRWFLDVIR